MRDIRRGLVREAWAALARMIAVTGVLLFLPAWSLGFWQAWVFLAVFSACVVVITGYFLKHDPELVERRLRAGAVAEKEKSQKIIQGVASGIVILMNVLPGLDRRFGWSDVPAWVSVLGEGGVALGFGIVFRVFKENTFTSATIEVAQNQRVISSGPYRVVRHPMYAGSLVMFLAAPVALGSYWTLLTFPPMAAALVFRLLHEEKYLAAHLPGYAAYSRQTRSRLIPWVW